MWSFEVVRETVGKDKIWVLGKLICYFMTPIGIQSIVKMQYGGADVKRLRESGEIMDIGNDLKSATTDALKKCASELGIASDIYWKEKDEPKYQENQSFRGPVGMASPKQIQFIYTLCTRSKTDAEALKKEYNVVSMNDLSVSQAKAIIDKLLSTESDPADL
jgi:hypothetical protein